MIENSSAGLMMLGAEAAVTVTREEHHQDVLARYPVAAGRQRHVAVELAWCTIGSGKYRGQPAIEVRLDGHRVGELTHLMSQRYAQLVSRVVDHGRRPGCEAVVQLGARGLEVVLQLPRHAEGVVPLPVPVPAPTAAPMGQRHPMSARQRVPKPAWIAAAAVVGLLFIGAVANTKNDSPSTSTAAHVGTTTSAPRPTTTTATTTVPPKSTTTPPTTTTTTTTTKKTTEQAVQAPPPAPPVPPAPKSDCDPNYSGCVPIASDVDCAGGSGNGPAYVRGPIYVIGTDIYGLDHDKDGVACE
jgi:hypothetical protein